MHFPGSEDAEGEPRDAALGDHPQTPARLLPSAKVDHQLDVLALNLHPWRDDRVRTTTTWTWTATSPRHEAANVFVCEAFAIEHADPKVRGRGELKLSDLLAGVTGRTARSTDEEATCGPGKGVEHVDEARGCNHRAALLGTADSCGSRGPIWSNKDKDLEDFRIVGQDETLRPDTPPCPFMCAFAASRLIKLITAKARGAFLLGTKVGRKLYF